MPCSGDYMEPTAREIELSKVYYLLGELKGQPIPPKYDQGYHPDVYNKGLGQSSLDSKTEELCSLLQNTNVKNYSLEMQIWWRDHQAQDTRRIKENMDRIIKEEDKKIALSKLSSYERSLLGL